MIDSQRASRVELELPRGIVDMCGHDYQWGRQLPVNRWNSDISSFSQMCNSIDLLASKFPRISIYRTTGR